MEKQQLVDSDDELSTFIVKATRIRLLLWVVLLILAPVGAAFFAFGIYFLAIGFSNLFHSFVFGLSFFVFFGSVLIPYTVISDISTAIKASSRLREVEKSNVSFDESTVKSDFSQDPNAWKALVNHIHSYKNLFLVMLAVIVVAIVLVLLVPMVILLKAEDREELIGASYISFIVIVALALLLMTMFLIQTLVARRQLLGSKHRVVYFLDNEILLGNLLYWQWSENSSQGSEGSSVLNSVSFQKNDHGLSWVKITIVKLDEEGKPSSREGEIPVRPQDQDIVEHWVSRIQASSIPHSDSNP